MGIEALYGCYRMNIISKLANVRVGRFGLGLFVVLCPTLVQAAALQGLDVVSLSGGKVELKLSFDSAPPKAQGYIIERPARISLDLPDTSSEVNKYNDVNKAGVKSVTVLEVGNRTRLIINLDRPESYTTRTQGDNLFVIIGGQQMAQEPVIADATPAPTPAPVKASTATTPATTTAASTMVAAKAASATRTAPAAATAKPAEPKAPIVRKAAQVNKRSLTEIDFERGSDGEGNILIGLGSKDIHMDLEERSGRIRLTFPNAELAANLRNRLDVTDFATPVKFIDATVEDGKPVIIIEPEGNYDYLAWQTADQMVVSVRALDKNQSAQVAPKVAYSGDKLSLNFQNIEVRAVLQILADFKDLNLVASDAVNGNVTLTLKSVPWDQALDIVLRSKGLDKRLDNNVLIVAPARELAEQERELLASQQQIVDLSPIRTDLIQVNYADAADIAAVLVGDDNNRILSERGSVQVIDRTNSLLLSETADKLDEIRALIEKVDIPIRQVQIEARIVVADTSFNKELGVKWGGSFQLGNSNNLQVGGAGSGWENDTSAGPGADLRPGSGFSTNGLFTDLSVTGTGASALTIGMITDNTLLNLELSALESDGGGEIISQPKVITSDKHKAVIKSGKEIPYQESTSSGATSVSFKEAVLGLEVTPQITPDGRIIMAIKVSNNDTTTTSVTGVPIIDTTEVETKVLIDDGQTIVLGGIFKNTTSSGVDKVPLLGDLPGIGRLFRKDIKRDSKAETLVFITPKILSGNMALR